VNESNARLTDCLSSTHFRVNGIQKEHCPGKHENCSHRRRKTNSRKCRLGFHHWSILKIQHYHMLVYAFSRSKTVLRCWCNIKKNSRDCVSYWPINNGSIARKSTAGGGKDFCCPGFRWVDSASYTLLTVHPQLVIVGGLQLVAANWSILGSEIGITSFSLMNCRNAFPVDERWGSIWLWILSEDGCVLQQTLPQVCLY
jgi:hypothetical protein